MGYNVIIGVSMDIAKMLALRRHLIVLDAPVEPHIDVPEVTLAL